MHAAMYALESQREMAEYYDGAEAHDVIRSFYPAFATDRPVPSIGEHFGNPYEALGDLNDDEIQRRADLIRMGLARQMRLADTYWVQNNMVALVDAAFESMPSHPMTQETLPVPFGWMYLGRGTQVEIGDWVAEGLDMFGVAADETPPEAPGIAFRAVSWRRATQTTDGRLRPGYEIWFYMDRDTIERKIQAGLPNPRWTPMVARGMPPFIPVRSFFWADGQTSPDEADSMVDLLAAQWFQAAVILMEMPISVKVHAPSNRQTDRRAQRAQMPIKLVTIITLRSPRSKKEGPEDPEHEGREYSHRWLVRGFWRNQYYPSSGEHKVIYINPFIKGPADAPLMVKQKVNAWVR